MKPRLPPHPATITAPRAEIGPSPRHPHIATTNRPLSSPATAQASRRITSVLAYRLERNTDSRKVVNDKGSLELSDDVENEGISISFGSEEHVDYYLNKHKEGIVVVMEISAKAYAEIQQKLIKGSAKVGGKSLSRPSPCSDSVMKQLSIAPSDVLTFSGDWKEYLEANMSVRSVTKHTK